MICTILGHRLKSLRIDDGIHYNIPAIKCKTCKNIWNFQGEDQGWTKRKKEDSIHLGRGKDFEPYFGLTRDKDKRYRSLTPKELAPLYIQHGLAQNALSTDQARELREMPPDEVVNLFTQK
jgi:hypothetical protein